MMLVKINRRSVDECYQTGLVKPNEFRQIYTNIIEKEIALRLESMTIGDKWKMFRQWQNEENWLLSQYSDYSYSQTDLYQAIMELAGNEPERLLINAEEAKLLFLSSIFHKRAALVRDCSDLLNNDMAVEDEIYVDKETLRAMEYIKKYVSGGRAVLATLQETEED